MTHSEQRSSQKLPTNKVYAFKHKVRSAGTAHLNSDDRRSPRSQASHTCRN